MTKPIIRIHGLGAWAPEVQESLPYAELKGGDVIIRSARGEDATASEHVVWMTKNLDHRRKYLKRLIAQGAGITCEIAVRKGGEIDLMPNAVTGLHLIGAGMRLKRP